MIGQPAHSSTKLGHEMSLLVGWVDLTKVVPNLATRCLYQGWEEGAGAGVGAGAGIHLIKDQPAQSSTKLGNERSLWGVHLAKGQPA